MNMQIRPIMEFFSPTAFEQRARDRERRQLAAELEDIALNRAYNNVREPMILQRSQELDRLDSIAACQASKVAACQRALADNVAFTVPMQATQRVVN